MGYFTFLFSYEVFEIWCLHSVQPHLKCLTAAVSRAGTIDFWTKYFFAVEAALCIIEALAASLDASSIPILQLWQPQMSPDNAKCPLEAGAKLPLVKNHWSGGHHTGPAGETMQWATMTHWGCSDGEQVGSVTEDQHLTEAGPGRPLRGLGSRPRPFSSVTTIYAPERWADPSLLWASVFLPVKEGQRCPSHLHITYTQGLTHDFGCEYN